MENGWPDNIEPLRAGLTDEEFADLLDRERWTEDEAAMLRAVAVDFGQDLMDALELPGLDDQAGWGAVDAEMLDMAAAAHLTVGPHPWLLPLTYMRGSLARDLVARPLRPLADWLAGYPH